MDLPYSQSGRNQPHPRRIVRTYFSSRSAKIRRKTPKCDNYEYLMNGSFKVSQVLTDYVNILPNTLRKFLEVELTKSDVRNKAMYTPLYSEFAFTAGGFPNIFERRTTKMSFAHIFRNSATSTSTESSKQYQFRRLG